MSARAVTDRDAVLRALEACKRLGREAFAAQHGFGRAQRYELVHQGEGYDPAAIVAVAHGEQHGRVLGPSEVRGAAAVLRRLGFEIVESLPPWREDEMVLGLDVYLRHRGERLGKGHRDVLDLSDTLRRLGPLQGEVRRAAFRNPAGVEQQLGKFLSLDPHSEIEGRGQPSALHRAIWDRYARKPRALRRRVAGIMNALEALPRRGAARREPLPVARDAPRRRSTVPGEPTFEPFEPRRTFAPQRHGPGVPVDASKMDRAVQTHEDLRVRLGEHLAAIGFTPHGPARGQPDLDFDLAATRDDMTLLVEVKSLPPDGEDRSQLRLGLGQLLWYRSRWRHCWRRPCVAVLCVEREPQDAEAWLAACADVAVVLTWPARLPILIEECRSIAELGRAHAYRADSPPPPTLAPPPRSPRTRRR